MSKDTSWQQERQYEEIGEDHTGISLGVQKPQDIESMTYHDALVVGGGPYGLSTETHLKKRELKVGVLGKPMNLWREHTPKVIFLRSYWWATNISDPRKQYGLDRYLWKSGRYPFDPLPEETFIDDRLWFNKHIIPDVDEAYKETIEGKAGQFMVTLVDGRAIHIAAVVMTSGLRYYTYRPAKCNHLPAELISHTSDHRTFDRFASMIDLDCHLIPDALLWARIRESKGIAADAIAIVIICRLAPEKSIDVVLEGLSLALSKLLPELRASVRVIIAGDGPLRKLVEDDIHTSGLSLHCVLWRETSQGDVTILLGFSCIFLYTSIRGACLSMDVLEAMASACAIIASTKPLSYEHLLTERCGIAIPAGSAQHVAQAIFCLVNDSELCRRMGRLARDYVASHHNALVFRKILLRATGWPAPDQVLQSKQEDEAVVATGRGI